MAVGNTFGATALSSYGGFWIAYGILLTPNWNILGAGGPYDVAGKAAGDPHMGNSAVGFFLTGWFIFTTILLLCTLRSTIMFFMLFFTLDLAFLMLACGDYATNNGATHAASQLTKAGGGFGMIAAFLAWYNAFAGIADTRYVMLSPTPLFYDDHCTFSSHHLSTGSAVFVMRNHGCASSSTPHLWAWLVPRLPSESHWRHANPQFCGQNFFASRRRAIICANPTLLLVALNLAQTAQLPNNLTDSMFLPHSNSFFLIPVFHFPWSEKGRENRAIAKSESHTA